MKPIFILLFIPFILLSYDNHNFHMKGKANSNDTIVTAKLLINNYIIKDNFISNITAKADSRTVLKIRTSSLLYKKPIIKYKFKDITKAKSIKYILTNNHNEEKEFSFKIERVDNRTIAKMISQTTTNKSPVLNETKPWKAITIEGGIKEVYGQINKTIPEKIEISDRYSKLGLKTLIAGCGFLKLHITSNVNLESFAIFTDMLSKSTVAKFDILKDSIIDYELYIKEGKITKNDKGQFINDFMIVVIGKARDGKFYKETRKGSILLNDDSCN